MIIGEEIAKRLSPAQRREILSADLPWCMAGLTGQRNREVVWRGLEQKMFLPYVTANLAFCRGGWWNLTPLGKEVRDTLKVKASR